MCLAIVTIDEEVVVGLWCHILEWQLVAVGIQVAANIAYLVENCFSSERGNRLHITVGLVEHHVGWLMNAVAEEESREAQ